MQIIVSLMLGMSLFTLIWSMFRFPVPAEPPVHRRVAQALGVAPRMTAFEQPGLAPLMNLALQLARRFNVPSIRAMVRRDLEASGNPNNYSVEEHLALAIAMGAAFGLVSGLFAFLVWQQFDMLIVLSMTVVGFAGPIWTLHEAAQGRIRRIGKQLPYTLDLVALMMEAGSTFAEAVSTLIRDDPGEDFNQELQIVLAEIDFGTQRATALTNLSERIPLDSLRSVVGAVNQAENLGTPLATILKSQSSMLRMHRSVRAEKLSASASLRILIPSMVILMAVVVVIFGPMIIRYIQGDFNLR